MDNSVLNQLRREREARAQQNIQHSANNAGIGSKARTELASVGSEDAPIGPFGDKNPEHDAIFRQSAESGNMNERLLSASHPNLCGMPTSLAKKEIEVIVLDDSQSDDDAGDSHEMMSGTGQDRGCVPACIGDFPAPQRLCSFIDEQTLLTLKSMFPQLVDDCIKEAWENAQGNFEVCADELLIRANEEHRSNQSSPAYEQDPSVRKVSPQAYWNEPMARKPCLETASGMELEVQVPAARLSDEISSMNKENERENATRSCDGTQRTEMGCGKHVDWQSEGSFITDATEPVVKRSRGRPKGSKDSKPRKRRRGQEAAKPSIPAPSTDSDSDITDLTINRGCHEADTSRSSSSAAEASLYNATSVPANAGPAASAAASSERQPEHEQGPLFELPPDDAWGKKYPDLRPWISVELYRIAGSKLGQAFNECAYHNHVRALVQIALHPHPICKLPAALRVREVGAATVKALREEYDLQQPPKRVPAPEPGRFATTAAAALAALLDLEERDGEGEGWYSAEEVLQGTQQRMDGRFPGVRVRQEDRDVGWMQVRKLAAKTTVSWTQLVVERRRQGRAQFQLTDAGRDTARRLLAQQWHNAASGPYKQLQSEDGRIDPNCDGAVMAVDFREGGGMHKGLDSAMCDILDRSKTPYLVRSLPVSDYLWFCHGNCVAPVFVERKTAEDVACSIHDGRWETQQTKMLRVGHLYRERLQLIYIIEGDPKRALARGTSFVGDISWKITPEAVNAAVLRLPERGFQVIHTHCATNTMKELRKLHVQIARDARSGAFGSCLPYTQFDEQLKAAPEEAPRTAQLMPLAASRTADASNLAAGTHVSPASEANQQSPGMTAGSECVAESELMKLSLPELKEMCKARAEKVSGPKSELVRRLLRPRKPQEWIDRRLSGQDGVPTALNTANSALLIALHIAKRPMEKEELMDAAEEIGISRVPMREKVGPHRYDGWSHHAEMKKGGLIQDQKRNKCSSLWSLTPDGEVLAAALHRWAHRNDQKLCRCGATVT